MNRQLATMATQEAAPAGLAVAAALAATLAPASPAGLVLAGATLAVLWGTWAGGAGQERRWAIHRPPALGTAVPVRVLLAGAVLAQAVRETPGPRWPLVAGGVLLLGPLLLEGVLHRLARPWFRTAHLAVRPGRAAAAVEYGTGWLVPAGAVVLVGLIATLGWPSWLLLLPSGAAAGFAGWLLADGLRRWRTGHRTELAPLTEAVTRHQPRFLLYFSAPPGSAYQATMWLPYLARVGEPFLVVAAEPEHLPPLTAATDSPVVVCDTFEALDAVLVPSLRAAFYVNNGMKNAHCVRVSRLTHVQLYHGDSDKAVTASPLNAMFDRIFVAGQAAIDRFAAHGVEIPREKFRIVGRPQVERLAVADRGRPVETVLYAPTWVGAHADARHCSLPIAEPVITGLLARGVTVILRPHPYSRRDPRSAEQLRRVEQLLARDHAGTGRAHRWGRAATDELSLFDCMNRSDAMICDVSSVASEYLYTGKPFAITDMGDEGGQFPRTFPLAKAAYVLEPDAGNLAAVLDDLLARDPLAPNRRELRAYYLGEFPPDRYAEAFLTAARACVTAPDQLRSAA